MDKINAVEDAPTCSQQLCCLIDNGYRCHLVKGNASFSKRIQKTVIQKRLNLVSDAEAGHTYICEYHKTIIKTSRPKRKQKRARGSSAATLDPNKPDLSQLQLRTLRRYKKHFKVSLSPGLNKVEMAEALTRHFETVDVDEKDVLSYFIYSVRTDGKKLDTKQARENVAGPSS